MSNNSLTPMTSSSTSKLDRDYDDDLPRIGQFYWVKETVGWDRDGMKKGDVYEWFGCIMSIGTNYVELHSAKDPTGGYSTKRVHLNDFDEVLRLENEPDAVVAEKIAFYQGRVNTLLGDIQEVTQRLGVVPQTQIARPSDGSNTLAVLSEQIDTSAYKQALIKAKDETLPDLFKQMEKANGQLAKWMMAKTLPVLALMAPMKGSVTAIEDRIYTIGLYAGLTEDAVKCCDGDTANMGDKLHVMQRRLYMDEECLMDYRAGGMEFKDISEFDAWISEPGNRDRLLPFPRTLAAFRVRRNRKEREDGGNMLTAFINMQIAQADEWTYLYVRNGEQVWRIIADFEFDSMIFPDQSSFDPSTPKMVKLWGNNRIDKMMSVNEYEVRFAEYREQEKLAAAWDEENKGRSIFNPHRHHGFRPDEWKRLDQDHVFFDDANKMISDEIKKYNRVATIIQGLFDRSLVLHPHPPVRVWSPEGFAAAITLVYDNTTLPNGEKPDFEAYRARLNALITADSLITGQEDFWEREMADRENKRQENDWRNRNRSRADYTRFRPYGNPGPGVVSTMYEWKPRVKKAVFRWMREAAQRWRDGDKPAVITVPVEELFNVSAYTPGDYRQFFADHRTRAEYLKWAPLLLTAEDYYAGKIKVKEPAMY